jgi:hypothetical protein
MDFRYSVADPRSGAFFTPGSGIGFSRSVIFESFMTIFGVKSTIILSGLAQIFSLPK